jgi:hypothetical protein
VPGQHLEITVVVEHGSALPDGDGDALLGELDRAAKWVKDTERGEVPVFPPSAVVRDVRSQPHYGGLLRLRAVVEVPLLRDMKKRGNCDRRPTTGQLSAADRGGLRLASATRRR